MGGAPLQAGCKQRQAQTGEEPLDVDTGRRRGDSCVTEAGMVDLGYCRHTVRDRKTVRACLAGEREAGMREQAEPDVFGRFEPFGISSETSSSPRRDLAV